jgi:2-polyprenyl-3-methyl-5-hydroxy-6-metoxy-1,4-benzoquinol methylase
MGRVHAQAQIDAGRWNHNIRCHPYLLAALPERCERALDVGCGEGILARKLRTRVAQVCAIDIDERSIESARRHDPAGEIDYLLGDFLTYPFRPTSYDFVVSVAALNHMDPETALKRMRNLLQPRGTLAIVGMARTSTRATSPATQPRPS